MILYRTVEKKECSTKVDRSTICCGYSKQKTTIRYKSVKYILKFPVFQRGQTILNSYLLHFIDGLTKLICVNLYHKKECR